jgi:hypothetical protein
MSSLTSSAGGASRSTNPWSLTGRCSASASAHRKAFRRRAVAPSHSAGRRDLNVPDEDWASRRPRNQRDATDRPSFLIRLTSRAHLTGSAGAARCSRANGPNVLATTVSERTAGACKTGPGAKACHPRRISCEDSAGTSDVSERNSDLIEAGLSITAV